MTKNTQFQLMQYIFVLFFLWTAKFSCHESFMQ